MNLSDQQIADNFEKVIGQLEQQAQDAFYISSYDAFLSEYVPLADCHRYYFSGFSGSVAELLILGKSHGHKVLLFVDGRYHQQADQERAGDFVEVVKCSMNDSLEKRLIDYAKRAGVKKLAIEGDRTTLSFYQKLQHHFEVKLTDSGQLLAPVIGYQAPSFRGEIRHLAAEFFDDSFETKLCQLLAPSQALWITSLDQIAWLSNTRSYSIPYQSTFCAKALALRKQERGHLYLFLFSPHPISEELKNSDSLKFIDCTDGQKFCAATFLKELKNLAQQYQKDLNSLFLQEQEVSALDFQWLAELFGKKVQPAEMTINSLQKCKTAAEVQGFEVSFQAASKAIFSTFNQLITDCAGAQKDKWSEALFKEKLEQAYQSSGALAQSFASIVGVGENAAIIHYSKAKNSREIKQGELLLVDSGAFYQAGLATDCTRTMLVGSGLQKASAEQKKLYTLVLKGLLEAQHSVFPEGTLGTQIDCLSRRYLWQEGLDYAHGTGHGVGVNVHEAGYRLSAISQTPLVEGLVGSIEPGVYLPTELGIRLENVVVVEAYQNKRDLLGRKLLSFRPLNYIGYDTRLIARELLSAQQLQWLDEYHRICQKHGTYFDFDV